MTVLDQECYHPETGYSSGPEQTKHVMTAISNLLPAARVEDGRVVFSMHGKPEPDACESLFHITDACGDHPIEQTAKDCSLQYSAANTTLSGAVSAGKIDAGQDAIVVSKHGRSGSRSILIWRDPEPTIERNTSTTITLDLNWKIPEAP